MKGVSDMDAQNNNKKEGNKNEAKKPIQVLHISKNNTISGKEKFLNNNQSLSKELKTDTKPIKPQIIEAPINEKNENYFTNTKFEDKS